MRRNWIEKNVDLALLAARIGDFFKERDFEAVKGETPNGYQILAENSRHFKLEGCISLSIEGKPEDFVIDFGLCNPPKKHDFRLANSVMRMFTGGYFFLRRLKSDEAWFTLEKDLWHMWIRLCFSLQGHRKILGDAQTHGCQPCFADLSFMTCFSNGLIGQCQRTCTSCLIIVIDQVILTLSLSETCAQQGLPQSTPPTGLP